MHPKLSETLSKYDTIILVGGGTGGHIQPIINLLEKGSGIRETNDGGLVRKFLWVGGKDSNEEKEATKSGITFQSISTLKLSTTLSPKVLLYPFVLVQGLVEARKILSSVTREDEAIQKSGSPHSISLHSRGREQIAVFSKGGPGSVAVGIAAWSLGIPLYIHESDTIPGRSNRILGKLASKIFLGFDSAKKYFDSSKCEVVGQILHPVFSRHCEPAKQSSKEKQKTLDRVVPRDDGNQIDWKSTKPHILVICGSQGAKSIFEAIIEQYAGGEEYEWIIGLGKLNKGMKKDFEKMKDTQALEWISQENIAYLLSDTDIAITRGSATTLAEIDAFGVRKIIIPLPHAADNHQYWNAKEYEKNEDILLEQGDIRTLSRTIKNISKKI